MTATALMLTTGALTDTSERHLSKPRGTVWNWLTGRVAPAWANAIWIVGAVVLVGLAEVLR